MGIPRHWAWARASFRRYGMMAEIDGRARIMETYVFWLLAGFALIIAELLTGTFFLLVLGVAAFAGAAMAWVGQGFWPQALISAALAVAGVVWVQRHPRSSRGKPMASLDVGQQVAVDRWTDRAAGFARVRYRDTLWDAMVEGSTDGETYYIVAVEGNTLKVSSRAKH